MATMKISPSQTTEFTSTQLTPLGTVAMTIDSDYGIKYWRYVKFVDAATTYADGAVVTRASATTWGVSNDRNGGLTITGHEVVGIVHGAPVASDYGWVQCGGLGFSLGTFAAGDYLIPHGTNDNEAVISGYTASKANFNIFAKALTASTGTGLVNIMGLI